MKYLHLTDLKLGLNDLLTNRVSALHASSMGQKYEPSLKDAYATLSSLPPALLSAPLAEELNALDERHDGFGLALHHLLLAYQHLPGASDALLASIKRVKDALAPTLSTFRVSYASQAQRARENEALLTELSADLLGIPVAGDGTLMDWAKGLVEAGLEIDRLLVSRADETSQGDTALRKQAAALRARTLGQLGRLRDAIQDEVALDPSLPRDLEYQLFDYFDLLERNRKANAT